jgi:hypothetical protein
VNEKLINTKKAYDAFDGTCDEVGGAKSGGRVVGSMAFSFYTIMDAMKSSGLAVPDFDLNGDNVNNNNFLGFVDEIKVFTKNLSKDDSTFVPDNFYDFCDLYKEKLIQNSCT